MSKLADLALSIGEDRVKNLAATLVCSKCGMSCWASGNSNEPCWGVLHVSEEYPGMFVHSCDGHGHPGDHEYIPQLTNPT